MKLKFQKKPIDEEDPYKNDLLERREEIENLSSLVKNIESPAVIAIDSAWGTGKTTFVSMWQQVLMAEGFMCVYFNAWETDFSEDPLTAFLGEINDSITKIPGLSKPTKKAWEQTKEIGKTIIKHGVPSAIKVASLGLIDAEKIVEEEISKVNQAIASDLLESYTNQKNAITNFHESLSEVLRLQNKEKPLLIFVDELDRCRPNYAINLLERIKHLFSLAGVVFVLSMDKKQLCQSISAIYGVGIDSKSYLRRFIDLEYSLKPSKTKSFIESLFASLDLDDYFEPRVKYRELQYDRKNLLEALTLLSERQKLALREIEQIFVSINLALRSAAENEFVHPILLTFLVILKNIHPEIYEKYVELDDGEILAIKHLYTLSNEAERLDNSLYAIIEGLLIAAKYNEYANNEPEAILRHKKQLAAENANVDLRRYSEHVIHVFERPVGMRRGIDLNTLIQRIEFLAQFKFEHRDV